MKTFACPAQLTPPSSMPPSSIGLDPAALRTLHPSRLGATLSRTSARTLSTAATLACAALLTGCGSTGSPQAPSLKLPVPPTDLAVRRAGDAVALSWTMPRRATDRVPLTGDQRAVICRSLDAAQPSTAVGTVLLAPGLPATYTDRLPSALLSGPPHLLTYTVLLENRTQRGAGPSNPAYTAAGAAPPPMTSLHVDAEPSGIVLRWQGLSTPPAPASGQGVGSTYLLRLHRTRIATPGESPGAASEQSHFGVAQPPEQTLEVTLPQAPALTLAAGWLTDHAIDQNAALNHTYRYTVERVARLTLEGHQIEISGPESAPAIVSARDLFPPAVPQGLEAVADGAGRAIDLSWTSDADRDLAGYFVYRRVAGTQAVGRGALARASGADPLANSAWRDSSAQPGKRYAYSVSAVDSSGNESARSPEVEEELSTDTLPNTPATAPGAPPPHPSLPHP